MAFKAAKLFHAIFAIHIAWPSTVCACHNKRQQIGIETERFLEEKFDFKYLKKCVTDEEKIGFGKS